MPQYTDAYQCLSKLINLVSKRLNAVLAVSAITKLYKASPPITLIALETDSTCDGKRNSELLASLRTFAVREGSALISSPMSSALERGSSNVERKRTQISGNVNDFAAKREPKRYQAYLALDKTELPQLVDMWQLLFI